MDRRIIVAAVWVGTFSAGGMLQRASAASFDCAKAKRPVEVAICSDAKLSAADYAMATAYRGDLSRLSSNSVGLLRADQVQWLAWAQQVCRVNEPKRTKAQSAACLSPLYDERRKALRGAVAVRGGQAFLKRTQYLALADSSDAAQNATYPGFTTMTATWPAADSDTEEWLAWSAAVEAHMLKLAGAGQAQTLLRADATRTLPRQWDEQMAAEADSTLTGVLKDVEGGRVTAVLSTETMGVPAAHPSESSETLTWLLAEKRTLRAEDVFADANWKHALGALCWADLHTPARRDLQPYLYAEVTGPDAKPLRDVVSDVTNWTLEKDGLHISYPEYSVAPRMAQPEDTVIPWGKLKGMLKPGFAAP